MQASEKLTANEAATILHITPAALEQRRRRRKPPAYYRIGRKVLYEKAEIEKFLQSCKVLPEAFEA